MSYPDDNRNGASGRGWGVMILPQLEQSALYAQFDPTIPLWAPQQVAAMRTKFAMFLCPCAVGGSDGFALRRYMAHRKSLSGDVTHFTRNVWFVVTAGFHFDSIA